MHHYYFQIFQVYNFNNLRSLMISRNVLHVYSNFVENNDYDCMYVKILSGDHKILVPVLCT